MKTYLVKMRAGKLMIPVTMEVNKKRIFFSFSFNEKLKNELKHMADCKWHGYDENNPRKVWSVKNCSRNWFQLKYLLGKNPYEEYEKPLIDLPQTERPLF